MKDLRETVCSTKAAPKVQCRNSQAKGSGLDDTLENKFYIVPTK